MARKVDEPWTKCRNPTDLDWTRAFARDGRDPRRWPQTKPLSRTACTGTELHCKPTRSVDQLCEVCPSSTLHSSTHCSNDVSVDSVIGFSAGGSGANFTFERQRLHEQGGEDMIAEVEGRKPRKKKPTPQTTIVYNTVCNSGAASSATTSSGTPVRRDISTPPSPQSSPTTRLWRRFVVGILQKERMRVRQENALMMDEDL